MLAMASANIAFNCDLVNSLDCLTTGLRVDTTLCTGRAQAAKSACFRFGTDTILGFAVGGLCPRFKPMRSNLAHTALRLCPRRLAICAALRPTAQSFFSSATSSASQLMGDVYIPTANDRLVDSRAGLFVRGACGLVAPALLTALQPFDDLVVTARSGNAYR